MLGYLPHYPLARGVFNPIFALGAAAVWAVSPIYYRDYLGKFDVVAFNFLRNGLSASVLVFPAAVYMFGGGAGLGYAALGGPVTLGFGDTLFLLALRENGASVTTPVVYIYVLMVQLAGLGLGQAIPPIYFAASGMVILGVYVMSRGGQHGKPRTRGIIYAISAGVFWTIGQELIQAATDAGGNIFAITFTRNACAALMLGAVFLLTKRKGLWPAGVTRSTYGVIAAMIISDLVVGSLLFVYSISTIGVALTVILTSLSPLLTQVTSEALGKESPSKMDYLGGGMIVGALILAVAL